MKKFVALYDLHFGKEKINSPGKGWITRPTHDLPLVRKVLSFIEDFRPDTVILGGDQLNCGPVSHWHHGKPILVEGTRLKWEYDLLDREVLGPLENIENKVWLDGNHECSDIETRIYTEKGWTSFFELEGAKTCLSFNKEKNKLEWVPILAVTHQRYSGNMVTIRTRHLDIRVTENHRLIGNPSTNERTSDFFEAGNFTENKYGYLRTSAKIDSPDLDKEDALFELLGWFFSDGGLTKGGLITFYQSEKKVEQIKTLLEKLKLAYKDTIRDRKTNFKSNYKHHELRLDRESSERLTKFIPSRYEVPEFLKESSSRQIRLFLKGYILGDGTIPKDSKTCACIYLYKEKLRDDIHLLCTLAGYRTVLTEARPGQWHLFISDAEGVIVRKENNVKMERTENELVWCVSNRNQSILIQRRGKQAIIGNCWVKDLIEKEPGLEGIIEPENYLSLVGRGWKVIGHGGHYRLGKLYFYHGDTLFYKRGGGKFPVERAVKEFRRNMRFGHYHTFMGATDITPVDVKDQHTAICYPALCRRDMAYANGVPNACNQGFGYGYIREDGSFNDYIVFCVNGKFTVEGKTY